MTKVFYFFQGKKKSDEAQNPTNIDDTLLDFSVKN
jgi:hypothetical protein